MDAESRKLGGKINQKVCTVFILKKSCSSDLSVSSACHNTVLARPANPKNKILKKPENPTFKPLQGKAGNLWLVDTQNNEAATQKNNTSNPEKKYNQRRFTAIFDPVWRWPNQPV